jgi:hypothetical protein
MPYGTLRIAKPLFDNLKNEITDSTTYKKTKVETSDHFRNGASTQSLISSKN